MIITPLICRIVYVELELYLSDKGTVRTNLQAAYRQIT